MRPRSIRFQNNFPAVTPKSQYGRLLLLDSSQHTTTSLIFHGSHWKFLGMSVMCLFPLDLFVGNLALMSGTIFHLTLRLLRRCPSLDGAWRQNFFALFLTLIMVLEMDFLFRPLQISRLIDWLIDIVDIRYKIGETYGDFKTLAGGLLVIFCKLVCQTWSIDKSAESVQWMIDSRVCVRACVDNSGDLRDQDNTMLLRVLRERVRQMCANSFSDQAMVCILYSAGSFACFKSIVFMSISIPFTDALIGGDDCWLLSRQNKRDVIMAAMHMHAMRHAYAWLPLYFNHGFVYIFKRFPWHH